MPIKLILFLISIPDNLFTKDEFNSKLNKTIANPLNLIKWDQIP